MVETELVPHPHYAINRQKFSPKELDTHIGEWVAFTRNGTKILGSAPDLASLENQLTMQGIKMRKVCLEHFQEETICLGGAEFF